MAVKKRYLMPRPRKYDYQKDYPVRFKLHLRLPVETMNALEKMGYDHDKMSKEVEKYLSEIVEKNTKID